MLLICTTWIFSLKSLCLWNYEFLLELMSRSMLNNLHDKYLSLVKTITLSDILLDIKPGIKFISLFDNYPSPFTSM